MSKYQVRYTCSESKQLEVVDFITRNANKFIISREQAAREHLQCYVEMDITKKTWVNKFNLKVKGLKPRDKYVEPDKGGTLLYVCKGDNLMTPPEVLGKRGFTDEDVTNFHKQYWESHIPEEIQNIPVSLPEVSTQIVQSQAFVVKKSKKPTFMMEIRLILEDEYPDREWTMNDKSIVFKKIMFRLGQNCKNLDHIIISRMTYGVLNSLIKDKKEWLEYWYMKAFCESLPEDDNIGTIYSH